jgi:hypothetical protein
MANDRNVGTVSTIDMINRRIEEEEKRGGDAFAGLTEIIPGTIFRRCSRCGYNEFQLPLDAPEAETKDEKKGSGG